MKLNRNNSNLPAVMILGSIILSLILWKMLIPLALAQESVRLQLRARSGERYRIKWASTITMTLPDEDPDTPVSILNLGATLETRVKSVKSNGRMYIEQRLSNYATKVIGPGINFSFDTSNPDDIRAAETNSDISELLLYKDMVLKYEQEPTGEISDFELSSPRGNIPATARSSMEDLVVRPIIIFPDHTVRPLETWDCGSRSIPLVGIGTLNIEMEGALIRVEGVGDTRKAFIGVKGTARLSPDLDLASKAELEEFKQGELLVVSLSHGRLIFHGGELEATIRTGPVRVRVKVENVMTRTEQ